MRIFIAARLVCVIVILQVFGVSVAGELQAISRRELAPGVKRLICENVEIDAAVDAATQLGIRVCFEKSTEAVRGHEVPLISCDVTDVDEAEMIDVIVSLDIRYICERSEDKKVFNVIPRNAPSKRKVRITADAEILIRDFVLGDRWHLGPRGVEVIGCIENKRNLLNRKLMVSAVDDGVTYCDLLNRFITQHPDLVWRAEANGISRFVQVHPKKECDDVVKIEVRDGVFHRSSQRSN